MYDQRMTFYSSHPQVYRGPQQYPQASVYYYQSPAPYGQGKSFYPQEPGMIVHGPAPEPVYPTNRPPAPQDASYQRLRPVAPEPAPVAVSLPPPKVQEKKPRLSQPPPHPPVVTKAAPPPPPPPPPPTPLVTVKPKQEEFQIVLPQKQTFVPDLRNAPGCFDIVGRGPFPSVRFSTEVNV
jgi:hypothetical protein